MLGKVSWFLSITTPKTVLKRVSVENERGSFEHEIYLTIIRPACDGYRRQTTGYDGE
jgi:hypothetical protein